VIEKTSQRPRPSHKRIREDSADANLKLETNVPIRDGLPQEARAMFTTRHIGGRALRLSRFMEDFMPGRIFP
jgi:hypothetical protein